MSPNSLIFRSNLNGHKDMGDKAIQRREYKVVKSSLIGPNHLMYFHHEILKKLLSKCQLFE